MSPLCTCTARFTSHVLASAALFAHCDANVSWCMHGASAALLCSALPVARRQASGPAGIADDARGSGA